MQKKYIVTDETRKIRSWNGEPITVHRIKAAKEFRVYTLRRIEVYDNIKKETYTKEIVRFKKVEPGEYGGWIESDSNLSQEGGAWIEKGVVYGNARVVDEAWVGGEKTTICGDVVVGGNSKVATYDDKENDISKCAIIHGNIKITGNSKITAPLLGKGVIKDCLVNKPSTMNKKKPLVIIPKREY